MTVMWSVLLSVGTPSCEEIWSGEPSQISWARACSCEYNLATVKAFAANPLKRYRYPSGSEKIFCCRESATYQSRNLIGPYHFLGSLVPRPHPAFRRLQYGKAVEIFCSCAGRAWERGYFLGISPRNTFFVRPFLTRRLTQAGHNTNRENTLTMCVDIVSLSVV